ELARDLVERLLVEEMRDHHLAIRRRQRDDRLAEPLHHLRALERIDRLRLVGLDRRFSRAPPPTRAPLPPPATSDHLPEPRAPRATAAGVDPVLADARAR